MASDSTPTVELYVRSLSAGAGTSRVADVLDRLERLDANGDIGGFGVTVWGDGVSLDERVLATDAARTIRDRVEEFRKWADETDRELLGFDARTTRCAVTGEVHRNLTVPTVALVERRDGEVTWVAPCRDGRPHSVDERLGDLAGVARGAAGKGYVAEADD